jgi:hypothetical protein
LTITSTTRKAGPYLGNNVTTAFSFDFKVFKKEDVTVTFTDANGVDSVLALDSDYNVVLNTDQDNNPGGTITYPRVGSPLAVLNDEQKLTFTGGLAYTQPTDIPNLSPFFPQVVEDAFDRAEIQIQQIKEITDRAIKISVSDSPLAPLPQQSARANTVIGFDALGNVTVLPIPSAIGAGDRIPYSLTSGVDFLPGDTHITLPRAPGSQGNLEVNFDAVPRDFTQWVVDGQTVTFTTPIPAYVTKIWGYIGTTLSTQIPPSGSVGDSQIVWNGSLRKLADSVAQLRTLDGNRYSHVETVGYYPNTYIGGGLYAQDYTDSISADNGGTVIVGSDGTRWKLQYQDSVCVTQFGARPSLDGVTIPTFDSSSAFNALMADASAKVYTADFGSGMYYAPQIRALAGRLHITGSCEIYGATGGAFDYHFEIKNAVDLRVDGRILFAGRYNSGYACGVKLWADTGVTSLVFINGFSFPGHRQAWQFGDPSQPDKQVSEITIRDGYTYGCPIVYAIYGTQTFVTFSGYQLRSSYGDGTGAWLTLPTRVGLHFGGHVTVADDCEILMTEVSTGAGFELNAIASADFGNQYGTIKAVDCVMECAATFVITGNPNGVSSPQGGLIHLDVTGIHTQNAGALIQTDANFIGNIVVPDTANIYATTARSFANVACSGAAHVYVGDKAFGKNCLQGLAGISGGIAHFSTREIIRLTNLGGQSFPTGTTTAKFSSQDNTGDRAHFQSWYNAATGVTTLGQALKDVEVFGGFYVSGMTSGEAYVKLGGTTVGISKAPGGTPSAALGDIPSGSTIWLDVNNLGSGIAAGSAPYDFLVIKARN